LSEDARIADSLAGVRARMDAAAQRAGRRPDEVVLVGVAKRKAAEHVAAAVRAGLRDIGENYVQEAAEKIPKVNAILETGGHKSPRWHFIGRLQRNKAGTVARAFDRVETVDRSALGTALNERAADRSDPLEVLIQVNLSGESPKGGVAPEAALELLAASRAWPRLRLIGLMAVPAATDDPERSRPAFERLRLLRAALQRAPGGEDLRELSMGMSQDFEVAIEEGATIVRVGTAIFGAR
jgi:pyridoxal phosphate enzyme (YggS family)